MMPSYRSVEPQLPTFHIRSRLGVARDVAVVLLCLAMIVGFLVEIWRPATAPRPASPSDEPTPTPSIASRRVR